MQPLWWFTTVDMSPCPYKYRTCIVQTCSVPIHVPHPDTMWCHGGVVEGYSERLYSTVNKSSWQYYCTSVCACVRVCSVYTIIGGVWYCTLCSWYTDLVDVALPFVSYLLFSSASVPSSYYFVLQRTARTDTRRCLYRPYYSIFHMNHYLVYLYTYCNKIFKIRIRRPPCFLTARSCTGVGGTGVHTLI